jgi:hypothetical protein
LIVRLFACLLVRSRSLWLSPTSLARSLAACLFSLSHSLSLALASLSRLHICLFDRSCSSALVRLCACALSLRALSGSHSLLPSLAGCLLVLALSLTLARSLSPRYLAYARVRLLMLACACAFVRLCALAHSCSHSFCFARSLLACSRSLSLRYLACAFACSIHARLLACSLVCMFALTRALSGSHSLLPSLAGCLTHSRSLSPRYLACSFACSIAHVRVLMLTCACALVLAHSCSHLFCFARSLPACSRSLSLRYLACAFACSIAHARLLDSSCSLALVRSRFVRLCALAQSSLWLSLTASLARSLSDYCSRLLPLSLSLSLASLSRLHICLFDRSRMLGEF